jgi:hypothetical protein
MEMKKSFFIPNNNKQDGNKTLKNHKHKTVYMAIYLITSCHSWVVYGVKPLIHQSELRTYTKVVPFQEKTSLCSIVKTTEWNGMIKTDN